MGRPPLVAALVLSAAVFSGSSAAQFGIETGRVILATVTDRFNRPIVDLDVFDFVVNQGSERREVFGVWIADYPLVLLLDNSSAAAGDLPDLRAATARFVARIGERPVAILALADPTTPVVSFDDDRETALARIEALQPSVSPAAPLQSLSSAARLIAESETPFSAVVLVAASPVGAEAEPPGLLATFLDSRAILHVIAKGATGSLSSPLSRSENVLRTLTERSGGRFATVYSAASFQVALDQVADRLATEMMIEFLVPPGARSDQEVRVGVTLPGARVHGLRVAQ